MVASTHWLASAAGMAVLERGGNAFDAAAAAGFTLQVVEPHLNGPGGEVPALLFPVERGEPLTLCGQGVAPAAATIERYRELGHDLIPGTGVLAACVPGAFGGWLLLLHEFGTWRLRDVLEFAIDYADNGFPVVGGMRLSIGRQAELLAGWPASRDLYLPVPELGTQFRNPTLASTYRRIVEESAGGSRESELERARELFYEGFVADEIHAFSEAEGGLLTREDLAAWRATFEPVVSFDYRGTTVCKTGPWGAGPVALQQLALLEGFDVGGLGEAEFVHVVIECAKLAFADRDALYGDVDVPLDTLLSREYNDARRGLVGDVVPGRAPAADRIGEAEARIAERHQRGADGRTTIRLERHRGGDLDCAVRGSKRSGGPTKCQLHPSFQRQHRRQPIGHACTRIAHVLEKVIDLGQRRSRRPSVCAMGSIISRKWRTPHRSACVSAGSPRRVCTGPRATSRTGLRRRPGSRMAWKRAVRRARWGTSPSLRRSN